MQGHLLQMTFTCTVTMSAPSSYKSTNPIFHAQTKHLEIHHHFVMEQVLQQETNVQHVNLADQAAGILTKFLPRQKKNKYQLGV